MARDDAWIAGIDTSVLWSVDRRSAAASVMLKQVSKKGERVRVVSGRTTIRPAVVWRVLAVGLVRRFRHASVAGNESAGTGGKIHTRTGPAAISVSRVLKESFSTQREKAQTNRLSQ
jgi:hypothetical protein